MGLFDKVLAGDQSLIKNEAALDFEFVPKILPFREKEQRQVAFAIKPLLSERNGRNLCLHGPPGIGKTAATKHVLRDLQNDTEEVEVTFINCWQANTTFKIYIEMCEQLGFKFTHNKNTQDLLKVIAQIVNKKAGVFVFDEIDKVEEYDFLYNLLEGIYRKSVILLTNYREWVVNLDSRVRSRLTPEMIEFKQYNQNETREILKHRINYAFVDGTFGDDALTKVAESAFKAKDIRAGLFLLRESALQAEEQASKIITVEHVEKATKKLEDFTIKSEEVLEQDSRNILDLIKKNSGLKIGDLFKKYQDAKGKASYKTFQRRIAALGENSYVTVKKQTGQGGNTTIIERKLTDF